jgi:hypothetical protein
MVIAGFPYVLLEADHLNFTSAMVKASQALAGGEDALLIVSK